MKIRHAGAHVFAASRVQAVCDGPTAAMRSSKQEPGRRSSAPLGTLRFVVAVPLLLLAQCAAVHGSDRGASAGGSMTGVQMKRLDGGKVGVERDRHDGADRVDLAPIVLWSGDAPAAVLTLRTEMAPVGDEGDMAVKQRLTAVGGGSVPAVTASATVPADGGGDDPDLLDLHRLVRADLDGDGVDELVVLRRRGEVEVIGLRGVIHRFAAGVLEPTGVHRARTATGDVVLAVLERSAPDPRAPGERSVVLRIDRAGVAPLRVGPGRVLAIGAVNRPGSNGVDELLAVVEPEKGGAVVVSRHAPDGRLLAPAREIYVPFTPSRTLDFWFHPQSRQAVLFDRTSARAFFLEAEKPVNWIHAVDLRALGGGKPVRLLGLLDSAGDARVLFAAGASLFAVGRDGRCLLAGSGGAVPSEAPGPLLTLPPPGPGETLVGVFPADGDDPEWVAVHTRGKGLRQPAHEEIRAAAERHLPAAHLAARLAELEPSLSEPSPLRDQAMSEERARRGVTKEIRTLEDWKRLLPDSWTAVAESNRAAFDAFTLGRLEEVLDDAQASDAGRFRDPEPLRGWIASLDQPARTLLTFGRGGAVAGRVELPGTVPTDPRSELGRPAVAFRTRGDAVTAILPLLAPDAKEGTPAFLFEVHAKLGGR